MKWLVAAAFAAHWVVLAREAWLARRHVRRGELVGLALLAAVLLATLGTTLRGGHSNGHDLNLLSTSFWDWQWAPNLPLRKELSSRLMLMLGGSSLWGILQVQKALWVLCAVLVYCGMRLQGAAPGAAGAAAGLLALNFLSILSVYSFSSALTNLFFVLSALCAAAGLRLAWFLLAAFLVFTSRPEFLPPLVLAFALRGRAWLPEAQKNVSLIAACAAAFSWWGGHLFDVMGEPLAPQPAFAALASQWGEHNLSMVTGLPPYAVLAGAALLAAAAGKERGLLLLAAAWSVYFGLFYRTVSLFTLEATRHHLYFFLPLLLAAAAALKAQWSRIGKLAAAAVVVYAVLNLRTVGVLQNEWRTNDKEWQFLYAASRAWPKDCQAVFPFNDPRHAVLKTYFPSDEKAPCRLLYRSPVPQIFGWARAEPSLMDEGLSPWLSDPWREDSFTHRFYLDSPEPGGETRDPVPVRVGFYRLPKDVDQDPRWRLLNIDFELIGAARSSYTPDQRRQAEDVLARARAVAEGPGVVPLDLARLLNDRGTLAAALGKPKEAAVDLDRAIKLSPSYLPPYLTLASLEPARAAKLYAAALKTPESPSNGALRALIGADLDRLRSSSLAPKY